MIPTQQYCCQAQSLLQLNWTELALFLLWRTYAAQPTEYAVQPTAFAAEPNENCESLFCHCPT